MTKVIIIGEEPKEEKTKYEFDKWYAVTINSSGKRTCFYFSGDYHRFVSGKTNTCYSESELSNIVPIDLGEDKKEEPKKLKPIEFVKYINQRDGEAHDTRDKPSYYNTITVYNRMGVNKDYPLTMMFAKDDRDENGAWFLGHLNDGVVE